MGAAEMASRSLGQILPLLVTDEHDLNVIKVGQARDHGLVITDRTVAVKLEELLEYKLEVIARLRALLMARDLDNLPGIKLRVDFALQRRQLAP
jgi:hypothetical protein